MDDNGMAYMAVAVLSLLVSIGALWVVSKKAPRGTVLGICVVLFVLGNSIDPGLSREGHLGVGLLRGVGFFGGILGLIDFFRKKRTRQDSGSQVSPPNS